MQAPSQYLRRAYGSANWKWAIRQGHMSLKLRRIIWDDGKPSGAPEDYSVREDGRDIGRIFRATGATVKNEP
jgi:hypothetical protein